MNKILLLVSGCIALLCLASGCSDNPALTHRYEAERLFFAADKLNDEARIKPELNAPGTIEKVRDAYGDVIAYCRQALPEIDSVQYPQEYADISALLYHASVRHTQFLFQEENYDSCVAVFSNLLAGKRLTPFQRMFALLNLGQSQQANGDWPHAVESYNEAVEEYYPPLTEDGENIVFKLFNVPTHVFRIYSQVLDTLEAQTAYLRAETYYRELMTDFPGDPLEPAARSNLAALYNMAGRYDDAITQLSLLRDSTGAVPARVQLQIAEIEAGRKGDFAGALLRYDELLENLNGADTALRPLVLFRRSMALLELDRFGESRLALNELETQYREFFMGNPTAQLVKAKSFELQGNWERAVTEYRFLIENYGRSDECLSTFLHLEKHFSDIGRPAEADRWFERGIEHCDNLINRSTGASARSDQARGLIYKADLYRQRKQWSEAAGILQELYDNFEDTRVGKRALITASEVYRQHLNQPQKADSLLEVFKRVTTNIEEPN